MPGALSSGIGGGTVLAGVLAVGVLAGLVVVVVELVEVVVVELGVVELGVVELGFVELGVVELGVVVVELVVVELVVVELLAAAGLVVSGITGLDWAGVTFDGSLDLATSLDLELSPYLEASLDFAVSLVLLVLELDLAEAGVGDSLEPQALSSTSEAMVAKRTSMMFLRSDGSGHWSRPT